MTGNRKENANCILRINSKAVKKYLEFQVFETCNSLIKPVIHHVSLTG